MRILTTILGLVFFFNLAQAQKDSALTAKGPEVISKRFEVNAVQFVEKEGKMSLSLSITNKGDFFSYPVVQVKVGDKIVANPEAIYFLYGMFETEQFVFETDLRPQDGVEFTILIGSGNLEEPHIVKYRHHPKQ